MKDSLGVSPSSKTTSTRSLDVLDSKITAAEQKRDFYEQLFLKKLKDGLNFKEEKEMFNMYYNEVLSVRKEKELVFANQNVLSTLAQADLKYQFTLARTPSESSSVFSYGWEIKQNALEYYGNVLQPNRMLRCQLTQLVKPKKDVACSHIYQKSWEKCTTGPDDIRMAYHILGGGDINEATNVIFLLKEIEANWDLGKLLFEWDSISESYKCVILDESIMDKLVYPIDEDLTFQDLDGMSLHFLPDRYPSSRLMAFRSLVNANLAKANLYRHWNQRPEPVMAGSLDPDEQKYVFDWISKLEVQDNIPKSLQYRDVP